MKKKMFAAVLIVILTCGTVCAVSLGELMIAADDGTFLGTFENEYSSNSIYNKYGKHGSKYESDSIFNKYGEYGSDYSDYSPFNKYANHSPWLMDRYGNYYGRLSMNRYASNVTEYSYDLACRLKAIRDSM